MEGSKRIGKGTHVKQEQTTKRYRAFLISNNMNSYIKNDQLIHEFLAFEEMLNIKPLQY